MPMWNPPIFFFSFLFLTVFSVFAAKLKKKGYVVVHRVHLSITPRAFTPITSVSFEVIQHFSLTTHQSRKKQLEILVQQAEEKTPLFGKNGQKENRVESRVAEMSQVEELTIKLFGKIISLQNFEAFWSTADDHHRIDRPSSLAISASCQDIKKTSRLLDGSKEEDDHDDGDSTNPIGKESIESATVSNISGTEDETLSLKNKEDIDENSLSEDKGLKKPDKILPCPRCKSMGTKFCYFNNYNVNQPRHFCKDCQRYWTAGGAMRNVAVGSGRRKNKCFRHVMIADGFQAIHADSARGIRLPVGRENGNVVTFGTETPLLESMPTFRMAQNQLPNGITGNAEKIDIFCGGKECANEHSSSSSIITTNLVEREGSVKSNSDVCQHDLPKLPPSAGPPWPFSPPGFPIPIYPAFPSLPTAAPIPWNMPLITIAPPSLNHPPLTTNANARTLGKHFRDGSAFNASKAAKDEAFGRKNGHPCVFRPKTMRIDDPNDVANSSIWTTLGITNDKDLIYKSSLFKAIPSKNGEKNNGVANTSLVLQANPAAFSRSQRFQESIH